MPVHTTRLAVAAAWTALLALGLFLPGRFIPDPDPALTTAAHVVLFAGLVGLWVWAAPRLAVVVLVVAVFVAVGTEAFQAEVVPGRGVETRDLWADFAGIAVGWGLAAVWKRHRRRRVYGPPRRPATPRSRTGGARSRRDVGSSVHA